MPLSYMQLYLDLWAPRIILSVCMCVQVCVNVYQQES